VPAKRKPERRRLLVVAAFIERRGRVLLSQRRADQSFPLAWEFPGGKVETGEALDAALVREIREELGCTIRVKAILDIVYHAYPDFDLIMPVYRASIQAGAPRALQVETMAWVPRQRLVDLNMPPADLPLAKKLSRRSRIQARR
jgi:8-oxo-dGTP diphosphatase